MFGNKSEAVKKHIEKKHWGKVSKLIAKEEPNVLLAAAKACGTVNCDESYNILVQLVSFDNKDVQIAAIEAMGKTAGDRGISTLTCLLNHPKDEQVQEAIHKAMNEIKARIHTV